MDFVAEKTPEGFLITAPATEHLLEELEIIILANLATKIKIITNKFDKEDEEVIVNHIREYEAEDG